MHLSNLLLFSIFVAVVLCFWGPLEYSRQRIFRGKGILAIELLCQLRDLRDQVKLCIEHARIAVGYNVCLDAIVDALELLETFGLKPPTIVSDHEQVSSLEQLASTFMFHFLTSSGGERTVSDPKVFEAIEESLYNSDHHLVLGGNAAIMAQVLANDFGFKNILLGGQVGKRIRNLLPDNVQTINMASGKIKIGAEEVQVRQDEVHIIMEYEKGASWGRGHISERANRFIISHDQSNAVIAPMEAMNEYIVQSKESFDLVIISGFHMLDAATRNVRNIRLEEALKSISAIPKSTKIHLELASIGDKELLGQIARTFLPKVDSIGLNEQELGALFLALHLDRFHPEIDLSSIFRVDSDVNVVSSIMTILFDEFAPKEMSDSRNGLVRIHFHSFSYHILAQAKLARGQWNNMEQAVAAGSIKSSERSCNTSNLQEHDISLLIKPDFELDGNKFSISATDPIIRWTMKEDFEFLLAPVLVCNKVVQTVGLGDSISASALAYQI